MKLQAEVGSDRIDVEIKRDGRKVVAIVDSREYELDVSEPQSDTFLLKRGYQIFEVVASGTDNSANFNVSVRNRSFDVRIIDKKRLRSSASESAAAEGIAEIRSAMPGKIVRILAEIGENVEKGQGIIVVEAMKMQNELKSPKTGVIKELRVDIDSTVSGGDVLVTIE
jgi:biotin carboxyl carrier protein